jgi:hypothetical protein
MITILAFCSPLRIGLNCKTLRLNGISETIHFLNVGNRYIVFLTTKLSQRSTLWVEWRVTHQAFSSLITLASARAVF